MANSKSKSMATAKSSAKKSTGTAAKPAGKSKKTAANVPAAKGRKVSAGKTLPGEDAIRMRAQEIYIERISRGEHGTAEEDWLNAEKQLRD
jgi:hypothetical protein